jgi:hypothetical protein
MKHIKLLIAAVLLAGVFAAPAQAHFVGTTTQASGWAQAYQNEQCGRGAAWACWDKRAPEAGCLRAGYHSYYCNGGIRQYLIGTASIRRCQIFIEFYHTVLQRVRNDCWD